MEGTTIAAMLVLSGAINALRWRHRPVGELQLPQQLALNAVCAACNFAVHLYRSRAAAAVQHATAMASASAYPKASALSSGRQHSTLAPLADAPSAAAARQVGNGGDDIDHLDGEGPGQQHTPPLQLTRRQQQLEQATRAAGRLRAGRGAWYASATRASTSTATLKVNGVEPEDLAPGWDERLAAVAARHGYVLVSAAARAGCIELALGFVVLGDDPAGAAGQQLPLLHVHMHFLTHLCLQPQPHAHLGRHAAACLTSGQQQQQQLQAGSGCLRHGHFFLLGEGRSGRETFPHPPRRARPAHCPCRPAPCSQSC